MTVTTLLKKLRVLHSQHVEIERQIALIERAIVAAGQTQPKARKRVPLAQVAGLVRATVKILSDAGEPLPCHEVASRLGMTSAVVAYRLQKAVAAGFVERISGGRYRAAKIVPLL